MGSNQKLLENGTNRLVQSVDATNLQVVKSATSMKCSKAKSIK